MPDCPSHARLEESVNLSGKSYVKFKSVSRRREYRPRWALVPDSFRKTPLPTRWHGQCCIQWKDELLHRPRFFDEQFGSAVGTIDYVRGSEN